MTSNQGEYHEKLCRDAGMNGFYNKPLNFTTVLNIIAEHHFGMSKEHLKEFINLFQQEKDH